MAGSDLVSCRELGNVELPAIDAHYAAGLFDGEGSITLTRKTGRKSRELSVSMSSTDRFLLEFMSKLFGGNIYDIGKRSERQKPIFHWFLKGHSAAQFCATMHPFLRERRKKARARLVASELAPLLGDFSGRSQARRIEVEQEILSY